MPGSPRRTIARNVEFRSTWGMERNATTTQRGLQALNLVRQTVNVRSKAPRRVRGEGELEAREPISACR